MRSSKYTAFTRPRYSDYKFFYLAVAFLILLKPSVLFSTEIYSKVVDGLGRPVANARVDILWFKETSKSKAYFLRLARLISDRNGIVRGAYNKNLAPNNEEIFYNISKKGHESYITSNFRDQFILRREYGIGDIRRIAKLEGENQIRQLREFLAGDFRGDGFREAEQESEFVFLNEQRFRSALRALIKDPAVAKGAIWLLALIAVPDDMSLIVEHAPPPTREIFEGRWAYSVVTRLLEPATEKEWVFLRSCVINDYNDRWVVNGAIQTLKLIASPESKRILQEVVGNRSAEKAIAYIESAPPPLADKDLNKLGDQVAQTIKIGKWCGNKKPFFNEKGDKALIDIKFVVGRDELIYTAIFHKIDGIWKLRGASETLQALLMIGFENKCTPF